MDPHKKLWREVLQGSMIMFVLTAGTSIGLIAAIKWLATNGWLWVAILLGFPTFIALLGTYFGLIHIVRVLSILGTKPEEEDG